MKKKIIIFCGHYLPGYKAGGILKAVSNFVFYLKDKIDLAVVTRDRDLGSDLKYKNIKSDEWLIQDKVPVLYQSKKFLIFFLQ